MKPDDPSVEAFGKAIDAHRASRRDSAPAPRDRDGRLSLELRIVEEMDRERARREARRRLAAEDRRDQLAPEILTLRERLARPRPATCWRIDGWLPTEARVVLAAQFKTGKTTLIGGLIRSLVDGDPWLGVADVTPIDGPLALIDAEMAPTKLDDWLRDQRIHRTDRVLVVPVRGMVSALDLLDDRVRAELAARLRGVRVLILDCLRPVMDALGLDEHREAGRLLVALDALLAEAGIPEAVVVHHMGHQNERSRGDSRLRDWPDVEMRLVRQDEDPASTRYIAAYGRDVDQPEQALAYDPVTRRLTIAGGSRRDQRSETVLEAVLCVLGDAGQPMTGRQIKRDLADDHARDAVDAALRHGVDTGLLVVTEGPRRSKLYRASVRVSGSVRTDEPDTVSECPATYREPDTGHSSEDSDPSVSAGHSNRTLAYVGMSSPRVDPWRDSPQPPGRPTRCQ